jgi:ribosomal protein L24E
VFVQRLFILPRFENDKCLKISGQDRAPRGTGVLFVSGDFQSVQDTKCDDTLFEHVLNLILVFSSRVIWKLG